MSTASATSNKSKSTDGQRWHAQRERRLHEESLRKQLAIAEVTSDLVATIDLDGFLLSLNPAGHKMLGLTPGCALGGYRLAGFFTAQCGRQFHDSDLPAAVEHNLWQSEVILKPGQGLEVPASQVLVAHRDQDDNVDFFSVVIRDTRALKEAETRRLEILEQVHQARKMETLGRLAGGVAHDFNNIITVIMGYAELCLLNQSSDAGCVEELQIILESAQKASRLSAQLLEFSSKQSIDPQILDMNEVLGNSEALVRSLMGESIECDLQRAPDLWPVEIDRSQLEQVILNLSVNARDAMGASGRFSIVTANRSFDTEQALKRGLQTAGDYVELVVSDSGCGIAPEHIEHVFEPFFTTKGRGKGTGMGLSAVYGAIRQNKGGVSVTSTPGSGTTFYLCLPRIRLEPTLRVADLHEKPLQPAGAGGETIMLVEDNDEVRTLVATILRDRGYRVFQAEDGCEAMALFDERGSEVDLVISDVVMPRLNGYELSQHLQKRRPTLKILLMSGHTDQLVNLESLDQDTLRLLAKPFATQALVTEVRTYLDFGSV